MATDMDSLKLVVSRETKDQSFLSLIKLANANAHKNLNLALAYIAIAHDNALKDNQLKDLFYVFREKGFMLEDNNQLENALTAYQSALKTANHLKNNILILTIYTDLAIVHEKLGKYKIAKDYHLKAIELAEKEGDLETFENSYHGIGSLYERVSDYDQAFEYYLKSLSIAEERKSESGVILTLQNISRTHSKIQNEKPALESIERAYQLAQKQDDPVLTADVLYDYANVLSNHGYYDQALEKQQASLKIYRSIGNKNTIARGLINIGDIYTNKKMYEEAREYFFECFKEEEYISTSDLAQLHNKLGNLYIKLDNIDKAEKAFLQSLNISEKKDFKGISQKNNYSLYQIYDKKGQHRKALARLETYISLNDYIRNEEKTKTMTELQFKFDVEKSEREIQSLMLRQNRILFLASSILFSCMIIFLIAMIRLKGNNNKMLKQKNKEIEEQNIRLEESNEVLKQFAYVAAHDLKEPLRNIGSFVSLIQKRFGHEFNPEANEYMGFVIKGVKRMNNLLGDLLQYSRITEQAAEQELINLHEILDEVSCNLREKIIRTEAEINFPETLPAIRMSRIHLVQIFQNLIGNALKFVKEKPLVEIKGVVENNQFLISVKDNGIGINKEYEHKIFNLFHQLNKRQQYEGTGIGLTICKNIVDKYDGKIWFESELNKGTTFFISLPISIINTEQTPSTNKPQILAIADA
ncbi:MAG: tetratricopeptide repeat protein [Bacteroidota bacterium]